MDGEEHAWDLGAAKGRTPFFYGWVVVALSFVDLALLCGVWYGFSAFVLAFTREFGWSRASISSVFALNMALYGFSGPAVGFLLDRFGARRVIAAGSKPSVREGKSDDHLSTVEVAFLEREKKEFTPVILRDVLFQGSQTQKSLDSQHNGKRRGK